MATKKTTARKAPSKSKASSKTKPRRSAARKVAKKKTASRATRVTVPTVAELMTSSVHTIGRDQPLTRAHEMMNQHHIRHLPVLDGGELVGIVSQRDLYFVETLGDTSPGEILLEEAMTQDVFETPGETPLAEVARTMIAKKLGCALVTRGGKVIGVFSLIDGLHALLKYLPG